MLDAEMMRRWSKSMKLEEEKDLEKAIVLSAIDGETDCLIKYPISSDGYKFLVRLGYKVTRISDPRELRSDTLIEW